MKKVILILMLSLGPGIAKAQPKSITDKPLADSLAAWVKVDQVAANVKPKDGRFAQMDDAQWKQYKDSVYNTHQVLLAAIFKRRGYPGYDAVGQAGAHQFWLMVQHCDQHPDFQRKVLEAMKVEVARHNADGKDFAYLTDRVELNTGKKQLYGTQVTYDLKICRAYPRPVADSVRLNERRKAVGMPPVEVYLNQMSELHFEMNKAMYEAKGITAAQLYPLPAEKNNPY